jgi:hypothetical protein
MLDICKVASDTQHCQPRQHKGQSVGRIHSPGASMSMFLGRESMSVNTFWMELLALLTSGNACRRKVTM